MKIDVTKIPGLSGNGFIKTSGEDGTLYTDTTTYLTGVGSVDHGGLSGLGDDDHSIYVFKSPAASTRNTISPGGDYTALKLVQGFAEPNSTNVFEVQNSALQNKIWISPELILELLSSPTGIYSAVNLGYLTGNYTTLTKHNSLSGAYTGYTGSVGDLSRYVYTDASRGFTNPISGAEPSLSYHLARLSTVTGLSGYIETQIALKTNLTSFTGHTGSTSNPHSVTAAQVGAPTTSQFNSLSGLVVSISGTFTGHTGDASIHFTQAQISIPASQVSDFTGSVTTIVSGLSGLFTGHTGDSSIHFTQASISISASQISDFSEAVDDRVGSIVSGQSGILVQYNDGAGTLVITYTGVSAPSFTPVDARSATGSISPGTDATYNLGTSLFRWSNIHSRVFTAGDTPSTVINDDVTTAHIIASGDDSDPTLRIYPYIGSAGNNAEFYTTSGNIGVRIDYQGNLAVNGNITISGGMITGVIIPTASGHAANKYYVDNLVSAHTSDSTIHFTKESINHTGLSGIGTNTHTQIDDHIASTSNPHTVTAAQVGSPTLAVFTSHTGDTTIHYTQSSISIPSSQISDFSEAVDDRVGALVTGLSGIGVGYNDAGNVLQITYTGSAGLSDHGSLSGFLDDDHTIYVIKAPNTSARNVITPGGDYVPLTLIQGFSETPTANLLQIQNSALASQVWVSPEFVLNALQNPTGSYGVPNLQYLGNNYTTLSKYNALSGSYTGFTGSVGTAAFVNIGSGINQVSSGMDPRFFSLAKKEQLSFTKISWWQHGMSNWTSAVSGTATAYIGQQRYSTQYQSNNTDPYSVVDCTNNVTGNAAIRYMNNRMIWMSNGRYYKVRTAHVYTGSLLTERVGFFGNDTNPTSMGSPTAGIWFEYGKLTGQTWYAKACAGGSTGVADLGITAVTNTWFELMFKYWISGNVTGVNYYSPSASGETVLAVITGAQVPTSAAQRQGTFFQQAIRHTGVVTDYPATQVEYFAMSDATGNWTYANAFS